MRKEGIIFLDVDGVLNTNQNIRWNEAHGLSTSSFYIKLPYTTMNSLRYIVLSTGAKLVLSSSWRLTNGLNWNPRVSPAEMNLRNQLADYRLSLYSKTPFINKDKSEEIEAWLLEYTHMHGYRPAYVILEDNVALVTNLHRGHIVYCNPETGLGRKEANIVVNLLYNQQY